MTKNVEEGGLPLHPSLQKKLSELKKKQEKKKAPMWYYTVDVINEMQGAVREVVSQIPSVLNELNGKLREVTMGDFDDCIQDAIDEAEKKMFALLVSKGEKQK